MAKFQSPRAITRPKIIGLKRNVNLICNLSLYTHIPNIKSISYQNIGEKKWSQLFYFRNYGHGQHYMSRPISGRDIKNVHMLPHRDDILAAFRGFPIKHAYFTDHHNEMTLVRNNTYTKEKHIYNKQIILFRWYISMALSVSIVWYTLGLASNEITTIF